MLEYLKHKLKMLAMVPAPLDPSRFGDPVAVQTQWTPARQGGTNITTHKLVISGPTKVEFRATFGALMFYLIFLLPGLGMLAGFFFLLVSGKFDPGTLVFLVLGLLFAGVGGYLLNNGTKPIVFEKARSLFWKGRKGLDEAVVERAPGEFVRLDDVHALQLLAEYCSSNKSSYYSYELNLVMKNGERTNVLDHGNKKRIQEDANRLAVFLGKPLWDATTNG